MTFGSASWSTNCARDLTKPSDKLIAIDALAREFPERYGRALGSHHAGL
jgi:hypothetical protein